MTSLVSNVRKCSHISTWRISFVLSVRAVRPTIRISINVDHQMEKPSNPTQILLKCMPTFSDDQNSIKINITNGIKIYFIWLIDYCCKIYSIEEAKNKFSLDLLRKYHLLMQKHPKDSYFYVSLLLAFVRTNSDSISLVDSQGFRIGENYDPYRGRRLNLWSFVEANTCYFSIDGRSLTLFPFFFAA